MTLTVLRGWRSRLDAANRKAMDVLREIECSQDRAQADRLLRKARQRRNHYDATLVLRALDKEINRSG